MAWRSDVSEVCETRRRVEWLQEQAGISCPAFGRVKAHETSLAEGVDMRTHDHLRPAC